MLEKDNFSDFESVFSDFFSKNFMGMRSDILHPYPGLKLKAYLDSLQYIEDHMLETAIACRNQNELFNLAIEQINLNGINAEFGVKNGRSITNLAEKNFFRSKIIYGFDSFLGLPNHWVGTRAKKSKLTTKGNVPKVPKNVKIVKGWFKDSLPKFLQTNNEPFSFMHIDCDIYESTNDILTICKDRIIPGSVIIFDEYFNYPGWRNHEYKAFQEFIKKNNLMYQYLGYAHTQCLIQIKKS